MNHRMLSHRLAAATLFVCLFGGCGGHRADRAAGWRERLHTAPHLRLPSLTETICPGSELPGSAARFTLALPGAVNPQHAPLPRTEAERHIFGSCYETLVRIDCEGRLEAGLARTWQAHDAGRTWVFQLREDARFWDGSPLGAVHVIASWRQAEQWCRLAGEPSPFLRFQPGGRGLEPLGPREVAIHLHTPDEFFPWLLAHPALSVAGAVDDLGWPAGSGPLQPLGPPADGYLELAAVPHHPDAPVWSRLGIMLTDTIDERDALDLGADVLVTRYRDVAAYFAARPALQTEYLPWDRSYYLVVPTEETGASPRDRRRWTSGWDAVELAREVSPQIAEPAEFFPLEPMHRPCPVLPPLVPVRDIPSLTGRSVLASRDTDVIIWPASDPVAGRLADRLAALAARPLGPGPSRPGTGPLTRPPAPQPGVAPEVLAVPEAELPDHIQAASSGAVVLPWPHRWALPCDELGRMLSLADWLVAAGLEPGPAVRAVPPGATPARPIDDHEPPFAMAVARRLERNQAVMPMLRTRAALVRKPALVGLRCDHAGSLRLWTGGWRDDPVKPDIHDK